MLFAVAPGVDVHPNCTWDGPAVAVNPVGTGGTGLLTPNGINWAILPVVGKLIDQMLLPAGWLTRQPDCTTRSRLTLDTVSPLISNVPSPATVVADGLPAAWPVWLR